MITKTNSVCSLFSACLLLFVLSVGPAVGQQELDEAKTLNQKVRELYQAGKYSEALPMALRALEIRANALDPDHPDVAASLNNLAELHRAMGDYTKAEPLYQRALRIDEKVFGPDQPPVSLALSNLASMYHDIGQYTKAEPLYQRSLRIDEKFFGPYSAAVATDCNNLAALYLDIGEYAKAESLHRRALEIREKVLSQYHPDIAESLNNLAQLYSTIGDYTKAEPLQRRALDVEEKALGFDHPRVASFLNNLAELYRIVGDYAKAEPLFLRALGIREKAFGNDHPHVATSLNSLAALYLAIGDFAKGEAFCRRALDIREKVFGLDHPAVAISLNSLAELYNYSGKHAQAEILYLRALAINEKAFGPDHPNVAHLQNNLASLYFAVGEYSKAESMHLRALSIREKALGSEHPDVALSLNNIAVLKRVTGKYAEAGKLYRRALKIDEAALGSDHPNVSADLSNLAELEAAQQNHLSALDFLKKGLAIQDREIQNIFTITTENQKLQFIQSISGYYEAFLSLIHQHLNADPKAVREGLALVLRRKGIVFDAQARAREVLQGKMPEPVRKEWDRLSSLRGELSRLLIHKPEKMSAEQYKSKLASLQQQIEESERRLASESTLVAKELQQRTLTVEAVAKKLSRNSALVEFVKVHDYDFAKGTWKTSWRYLAFVLTGDGNVTLVDLGEAGALEALAQRALADIKTSLGTRGIQVLKKPGDIDPKQQNLKSLADLYVQVWAPLEKALGKADKVVLSPDGLLNLVPFAALVDNQGRSLVERYQLAYVTSGRELVGADGAMPKPDSDLLLVANPSFDQKGSDSGRPGTALRSREFRGVFSPLPGTERESREIPPLVVSPKEQKQVLVGERATETAVKTARSPRILHLATHGFFLPDSDVTLDAVKLGGLPDRGITVAPRPAAAKRYENPLVRSGLAFAGANHATGITDGDDGILTALEITGMDLYGTELVVLSACDTGVGEIKTGEGVFGLRRAFALAGAKNLLMSLWEVSDEVTARQMKVFYQNLQKLPKAEALRQAQLETIKELKAEYGGLAPPGLWAPFILQGAQALVQRQLELQGGDN